MTTFHDVPYVLGIGGDGAEYVNPPGMRYDFDIGGIHFFAANSQQFPYQRKLSDIQKEQFDSSGQPGDNSLQAWWLRTQTDWSLGAGQEVMEPITEEGIDRAYASSAGVDTMTRPGWVSLLPLPSVVDSWTTGADPVIVPLPDGYVVAAGTEVTRVVAGVPATATAAGTVTSLVVAGPNVLVISSGKIEWAPLSGSFTLTTGFTCTGTPRAWWIKSRILIALGDEVHENPGSVITGSTDLDAATPTYDLGDTSIEIVGAAPTPASILLAVNANSGASILALKLDTNGDLPSTTAPVEVAQFPQGEDLYALSTYLGSYVGLSTSRGIRIGTTQDSGGVTYGPLLGSPVATGSSMTFSAYDRFLHYPTADAGDGRSGLVRIDLSEIDSSGRAAWSTFIRVPSTTASVSGMIVAGNREAYLVSQDAGTAELWFADDTSDLDAGWLVGSTVRFGTLETKQFDAVKIVADAPLAGTVAVSVINNNDAPAEIGTIGVGTGSTLILYTGNRQPVASMAVRVDLTRSATDATAGPSVQAWSIRAIPMVENRGETASIPLLNFDFERDAGGTPFGYEGRSYARWTALVSRVTSGVPLIVREAGSGAAYVALVEDMVMSQTEPPGRASGFGGVIQLKLRTR